MHKISYEPPAFVLVLAHLVVCLCVMTTSDKKSPEKRKALTVSHYKYGNRSRNITGVNQNGLGPAYTVHMFKLNMNI